MGLGRQSVPEEEQERGEGETVGHDCFSRKSFLSLLISLGEANCCFLIILTPSSSLAHKGLIQSW